MNFGKNAFGFFSRGEVFILAFEIVSSKTTVETLNEEGCFGHSDFLPLTDIMLKVFLTQALGIFPLLFVHALTAFYSDYGR